MSIHREIKMTCPKCKQEHPFVIWDSINTALDPEMKAAVRDRSAFMFECPSCGAKTNVDYGFLYHQMEDRIMIHYANSDKDAEDVYKMLSTDNPNGMVQDLLKSNYLIRIVRSQNELLEKIAIFDAGLDDRIIEIFKIYLLVGFQKDNPDCKKIEMLFFKDDKNYVGVFADDKPKGTAEIPDAFYDELCQKYANQIPDIRKDGPYIDQQWALKTLGLN